MDGLRAGDRQSLVVEGVVRLARNAGVRVFVEGVTEREQLEALERLGCELAQGYLFSPAMPPAQIAAYLARTENDEFYREEREGRKAQNMK